MSKSPRFHDRDAPKIGDPLFVENTIIGSAGTCNLSGIMRTSTTCRDYVPRLRCTWLQPPIAWTYLLRARRTILGCCRTPDRHVRSDSQLRRTWRPRWCPGYFDRGHGAACGRLDDDGNASYLWTKVTGSVASLIYSLEVCVGFFRKVLISLEFFFWRSACELSADFRFF